MSFDIAPNPPSVFNFTESPAEKKVDRLGVFLSATCAVHCLATPFVFLFLPAFGSIWAHPTTHWIAAAIVIPIALIMVARGFRRHGRRWVIATAAAGVLFILSGAAAPHVQKAFEANTGQAATASQIETSCSNDACCPSVAIAEDGSATFKVTPASVLTSLGGLLLIATHIGNLCPYRCCGTRRKDRRELAA